MPYLIDTDWTIDHLSNVETAVQLLDTLSEEGLVISIITYMEVYQGIARDVNHAEALAKFEQFLEAVPVVPFSLAVARRCAMLRELLKQQSKKVNSRALDLIIAATALEHGFTLVTRNIGDYSDIPSLNLYKAG